MTALLVCSGGGHLVEMWELLPRLPGIGRDRLWVTFDTPQSRSLLGAEDVTYVPYTGPREPAKLLRHTAVAARLLSRRPRFDVALSTGSGIALSFLPLARLRGVACHYIESATRGTGPSVTGRLLEFVPGISLYTQIPTWSNRRWRYCGSVLDRFSPGPELPQAQIRRVLVTVGTMQHYGFRRLVERVLSILPPHTEVVWQTGATDVRGLAVDATRMLSQDELSREIDRADVVIAHAGMGSSLAAFDAGKCPVLVPRRQAFGENVDDHHEHIAAELSRRRLAVVREADGLVFDDLVRAARRSVTTSPTGPRFQLCGPRAPAPEALRGPIHPGQRPLGETGSVSCRDSAAMHDTGQVLPRVDPELHEHLA